MTIPAPTAGAVLTALALIWMAQVAAAQDAPPALDAADAAALERLQSLADEVRSLPLDPTRLSTRAAQREARGVDGVHAFVRDRLGLEPYSGRVRGARGALFSHSGNSLDIALLVGELLAEQGLGWRLAHATLDDTQTARLLASLTPEAELSGVEVPTHRDAALIRWVSRNLADHWWVEAEVDGTWTPVDPVYPDLRPGQAVAEPTERVTPGELAARFAHRVSFRVTYRRGVQPPETALEFEADLVDLAYRNLVLSFTRESTRRLRPALDVGDEVVEGRAFERTDAERLWLELEFDDGATTYRVERRLRDAAEGRDLFASGVQVFSILFLPGWVGPDYYRAVAGTLLGELVPKVSALQSAATDAIATAGDEPIRRLPSGLQARLVEVLAPMTGLVGLSFALASDETALGLGAQSGVRPFFARPRILIAGAACGADGLTFELDLRDNDILSVPFGGLPARLALGFHVLRGRLDAALAGDVVLQLTARPGVSAAELLERAWSEGGRFITLSATHQRSLDQVSASPAQRERLEAEATGSGVVLAPSQPIPHAQGERLAWWVVQSSNGALIGVLDDGVRGAETTLPASNAAGSIDVAALVADTVSSVESLVTGVADQARHGRHARDQGCAVACDVQRLADSACGDPAAASVERCLEAPRASDDPLGLGLSCADMIDPFRCGSWIGRALVDGQISVEAPRAAIFRGPWSEPIESTRAQARCRCE